MSRFRRWVSRRITQASGIINKTRLSRPSEDGGLERYHDIDLTWAASNKRDKHAAGFLDLPRELRDCIYQLTLVLEQPFEIGHFDSSAESKRPSYPIWNRYPKACGLLSTCKQVHAEAAPVLYGDNHFETSLPKDSAALRDLLVVDEEAQKSTNSWGIPDRLMVLPFHSAYHTLVTNRSFRAGSSWPERDGGLKFLLPMIWSLGSVEGAYFRVQSLRPQLRRWWFRNDIYVAGWRRKGYEQPLAPHNKIDCGSSITFDSVTNSDDVVLAITRLTNTSEASNLSIKAPFAVKHLQFNVRVHACLLGEEHTSLQHSLSIEELHRRNDVLKIVYIFTPLLPNN